MGKQIDKKCENHCPNCGAGMDDIRWGKLTSDKFPTQPGVCKLCGCDFDEVHGYQTTTFTVGEVPRLPCPFPVDRFYTYMDEIPKGDRVSTTEDCEKCDEENCDLSHCLISGPHEDKFPPTNPLLAAAMEIVNDFDTYGEVIQTGKGGEYGSDSAIEILREAVKNYRAGL